MQTHLPLDCSFIARFAPLLPLSVYEVPLQQRRQENRSLSSFYLLFVCGRARRGEARVVLHGTESIVVERSATLAVWHRKWVNGVKREERANGMNRLEGLGMCGWFFNYYQLRRFFQKLGHTDLPHKFAVKESNKKFSFWQCNKNKIWNLMLK